MRTTLKSIIENGILNTMDAYCIVDSSTGENRTDDVKTGVMDNWFVDSIGARYDGIVIYVSKPFEEIFRDVVGRDDITPADIEARKGMYYTEFIETEEFKKLPIDKIVLENIEDDEQAVADEDGAIKFENYLFNNLIFVGIGGVIYRSSEYKTPLLVLRFKEQPHLVTLRDYINAGISSKLPNGFDIVDYETNEIITDRYTGLMDCVVECISPSPIEVCCIAFYVNTSNFHPEEIKPLCTFVKDFDGDVLNLVPIDEGDEEQHKS